MAETTKKSFTPGQEQFFKTWVVKPLSHFNTWLFRVSGGKLGGKMPQGQPILLLTTIGRKSGQPRTTPLLYLQEGDTIILVASQGGMSQHPLWYLNLEANPNVEVEIEGRKQQMRARRATQEEKQQWWPKLVALYRSFDSYQARTSRDIPVLILSPR